MRTYALLESREVSSGYVLRSLIRSCSLILSSASASYRRGSGCGTGIIFFPFSSAFALDLCGYDVYTLPRGVAGALSFHDPLEGTETRNTVSHCWDSYPSVLLRSRRLNISSLKIDADLLALSHSDLCYHDTCHGRGQ